MGVVRIGAYLTLGQWGCPNGFILILCGRSSRSLPCEFLKWEQVLQTVCRRLQRARLELVAIACEVARTARGGGGCCCPHGRWDLTLKAEVRRRSATGGLRFAQPIVVMEEDFYE